MNSHVFIDSYVAMIFEGGALDEFTVKPVFEEGGAAWDVLLIMKQAGGFFGGI